jgi:hypothetical protein
LDRTDACEICGVALDTGPFIFPNGDEKKLCKEHIEDILRSLKGKEQNVYVEKEIVEFKYVLIIVAVLVGIALCTIFLNLAVVLPDMVDKTMYQHG